MRERCYHCFRPVSLCFCEAIPRIDNRLGILILQHVGERHHPFNTARIVLKALRNCRLIVGHNREFGRRALPLESGAGLLYPRANAPCLGELPIAERPNQLVILDGTWHQAKTILRDAPQLRELPCYRLAPTAPGAYRIRREPDRQSLSTLEATVAALQALEPATPGLDQLLAAFHRMVESQLAHPAGHNLWRQKSRRPPGPRNVPRLLLQVPERLVVAYGEATPGDSERRAGAPAPVNWVAQRMGAGERFNCRLRQPAPLSDAALAHMRLSARDFDDALSEEEFCGQWRRFLRRDDVLVVYHQRTYDLLAPLEAAQPPCLVLKSIFGNWRSKVPSLEALIEAEEIPLPPPEREESRAARRLAMAVGLVERLRTRER